MSIFTNTRGSLSSLSLRLKSRESACRSSADPIEDWRGHLPLSSYYPCAGTDWRPIQAAGSIDTWLYADYAPFGDENPRELLKEWLSNPPEGLELERLIEDVIADRLSDWAPWPFMRNWDENSRVPIQLVREPVAMFARFRRLDGSSLRLMYVIGEASATLMAVYGKEAFTPWMLCLIQMGYGLGGGWDRFFDAQDSECVMRHAFRLHPAGMPPLILSNSYNPPEEFRVVHAPEPILSLHATSELDLRETHDRYRPQVADSEMVGRLFPGFEFWAPARHDWHDDSGLSELDGNKKRGMTHE